MISDRGAWKSNFGFLLAAVGSAVGLGNIWRFSYLSYRNGGAAFLIPYFVALFTVGVPILILEFAIGHKMRTSAPHAMHRVHPKWEWLGWWPVMFVMFGINLYYVVVIGWCLLYMLMSLRSPMPWSAEAVTGAGDMPATEHFFLNEFLGLSGDVFALGGVNWTIYAGAAAVWFILWFICIRNVDKGVELASKVFMPLLLVLTTVLVLWGFTLEGAGQGIAQYMRPGADAWARLGDVQVWRDAFGQIFFTLSLGFGIMIAYASYLPRESDLVRNAWITSLLNCGYSIFAGLAVFSVLGYMAQAKGVAVDEVVQGGPSLCFIAYPEAILRLPALNSLFGFLFFLTLVVAGITSAMSIVEAFASAIIDKFGWPRRTVVSVSCVIGLAGSMVFATRAGYLWLDIVDNFLNQYGLIFVGLLEAVLIGWYYRIEKLHFHISEARQGSYPKLWDVWWEWSVMFLAPAVLTVIIGWSVYEEILAPYGGYPRQATMLIGVGWVLATFLVAGFFTVLVKHRDRNGDWSDEDLRD